LEEEYGRDVDIVRRRIFKMETPEEFECTLHEEILPPAYRYMPALGNDFVIFFRGQCNQVFIHTAPTYSFNATDDPTQIL
jgi:hypothetical protein